MDSVQARRASGARASLWRTWLPLVAIVVVGALLRLYRVGELPPGLYRDEAHYGLDALGVLRGDASIYFVANNGREGLFIYLLAPAIALFGRTPEALRLTSALVGIATIAAAYLAARGLFSHRVGILSAAILATTFWHVALSRVAFRAITLPLLLCLTVGLLGLVRFDGAPRRNAVMMALAGVCFGLTFYTYTSGQFALPLFALFAVMTFFAQRSSSRGKFSTHAPRLWLAFGVCAALTLAPLLIWFARHPDLYFTRVGQVSILSPDINKGDLVGAFLGNVGKAAAMFTMTGDRIWRHNLSERPVFDTFVGIAFVAGLVACVVAVARGSIRNTPYVRLPCLFVLLWLALFLVPTILAEDTPHFLRAIGALPAACIVAAVGLEALLRLASRAGLLNFLGPLSRYVGPAALVATLVIVVAGFATATSYFNDYVERDMVKYWLEAQNVALANEVNRFVSQRPAQDVWLDARLSNGNAGLRFLSPAADEEKVTRVAVERGECRMGDGLCPPASRASQPVLLLVDPNHDWSLVRDALPTPSRLSALEGPLAQGDLDPKPRRSFVALLAEPLENSAPSPLAIFGDAIQLLAADSRGDAEAQHVTLRWRATRPFADDGVVFAHWLRNGQLIAQHDGSPANGNLPMPTWRVGDEIIDMHDIRVPGGAQAGDTIRVGVYARGTNARLRATDALGTDVGDTFSFTIK